MEGNFNKLTKRLAFKGKEAMRSIILINNNIMEQTNRHFQLSVTYFALIDTRIKKCCFLYIIIYLEIEIVNRNLNTSKNTLD
jgi:hypothetical protein